MCGIARTLLAPFTVALCLLTAACATSPEIPEEEEDVRGPGLGISLTGLQAPDRMLVPAIRGVVLADGQAVANRQLRVARNQGSNSRCTEPLATAVTDASGRFSFEPITARLSLGRAIKQLNNNWQVCLDSSDADASGDAPAQLIWYDQHTGVLFNREPTELLCDLGVATSSRALACRQTNPEAQPPLPLDSIN